MGVKKYLKNHSLENSLHKIDELEILDDVDNSVMSSAPSILTEGTVTIPLLHFETTEETSHRRTAIWKKKTKKFRKLGGKKRDKHFYRKKNKQDIKVIEEAGFYKKNGISVVKKSTIHQDKFKYSIDSGKHVLSPEE